MCYKIKDPTILAIAKDIQADGCLYPLKRIYKDVATLNLFDSGKQNNNKLNELGDYGNTEEYLEWISFDKNQRKQNNL
jgi:hypothetical protein